MRDAFAAWKIGLPAVVLVHEPFTTLAQAQFQALGAKDPVMVVYPQDVPAKESQQDLSAKAERVVGEITKMLVGIA